MVKVAVTGASGLLGRAVCKAIVAQGWDCLGLAFSRTSGDLVKCDLTNGEEVTALFQTHKPDFIIHAAAERFPDRVENQFEKTKDLNVNSSERLATLANACVLRIPVLYGPVERIDESAVTCLLSLLKNQDKTNSVSHYERRYPSHVNDISAIVCDLIKAINKDASIHGIFQWSGLEMLTKYDMAVKMADSLSLSHKHLNPDSNPTPGAPRPYDSQMDNSRLVNLGISHHTTFDEGIKDCMKSWL